MTASPAVATAGADAAPAIDPAPPNAVDPAGTDEGSSRRRRRKLLLLLVLFLAFAALLLLAIWYLIFRQPIPLPSLPGQAVMPSYVTSVMGADRPMGVAVSPDGGLIVATETSGDRTARTFSATGQQTGVLLPPVSTGPDHVPVYVARDPVNGELYVTDRPTGAIYIYDGAGTYLRAYQAPANLKGWQPLAIAFDKSGNLFVSDVSTNPQTIVEFDRSGAVVRTLGSSTAMSFPNGIAVDDAGNTYVTDSNNGRLLVFDPAGAVVAQIGRGVGSGNLGLPRGVAVDATHVYVADSTGQTVYVYAPYKAGASRLDYLGSFGKQGLSDGEFEFPNGLALDDRGRIYVVDTGNSRIQVWTY